MSQQAFALLHSGVQKAVWKMGWKELHPIQVEAIRHVLGGSKHLVITAQTAGGKTEAAFLPIISEIARDPQPSVQALYVGPLKALINDQFERLERLCQALEIPVHRWHGDVIATRKKALRQSPSGILLITPESLESNFINYGGQVARIYRHLRFVVIDELHSFLENVRGVHLRSLLARLNVAIQATPRVIGLSATIGDPEAARRFVCWESPQSVGLVHDPHSSREIRLGIKAYLRRPVAESDKLVEPRLRPQDVLGLVQRLEDRQLLSQRPFSKENAPELTPTEASGESPVDEDLAEIAVDVVRHFSQSTNLVFVNAKATIEALADKVNEQVRAEGLPSNPFVVHHGSLSKELREAAEHRLKEPMPTTALCSSTLEMGIDLGSVRAVGQLDPPWNVASLVQRLGRSGRRDGEVAVLRMYIRGDSPSYRSDLTGLLQPHLLRAVAMTRLMLGKWLEPPRTDQLHLSTLIHQIFSCLKQSGGMHARQLHQLLVVEGPFRNVDETLFGTLLRGLGAKNVIEQIPTGELILAPLGERIAGSLDFYAAFQAVDEYDLYYADQPIGHLSADLIPPPGDLILFGGHRWCVKSVAPELRRVFLEPTREGRPPKFRGSGGEIHPRVAREMRQVLQDVEEPAWLDQEAKLLLRAARYVARESGLRVRTVLEKEKAVQWFPWGGSRCLLTLAALAAQAGIRSESDSLSVTYHLDSMDDFRRHLQTIAANDSDPATLAQLVGLRTGQKFEMLLTEGLANYANGRDQLDLNAAREAIQEAQTETAVQIQTKTTLYEEPHSS